MTVVNVDEPGTVTLSTGEPSTGEAVTASLSDPDRGVQNLSWQWQRATDSTWTDITGAYEAPYVPGNDDVGHRLRATAAYDDNAGTGHTASAETAQPVKNDPPEFAQDSATFTVDENSPAETSVGQPVTATDTNGNAVTHSVSGSGNFAIEP